MLSQSSQLDAITITESETYQALLARAHRRTGAVPPESVVRHVLSVTCEGDWPVRRDALDAVLRQPRRPRLPRALRDRCRRRWPQSAAGGERLHQHRAALESGGARTANRPDLP